MKQILLLVIAALAFAGCKTAPSVMTKAAVTSAVAVGAEFGLEQYPEARPGVAIAKDVICAASATTNVAPQQVVDALNSAGITNQYSKLIVNGSLAIYNTVFSAFGADWVNNQAALQGYLSAVCEGLTEADPTPGSGKFAAKPRKALPPHLR